ncbi:endogenous retrovirus group K member 21 Gag polyprotein-like [Mauremys reevesii]|uniref:endogenous retrovirus group K member 21 Gag polyprotein-like n=1 Tax=Mauremys reevesii TaxID=260615 RepID=UPI00193F6E03|nr:endogenous retrovirus group K member 21 Gag polyprotein-like [Mauremys reevesii]
MILSPAQYVVWDNEFRLAALALGNAQNTAEQIYGTGAFATMEQQSILPMESFHRTAMCIQRAFRRVPASGKPLRSFTNVKQQATEPYHHFVDRLKEAVQRQIDNPDAQTELLLRLAYEQSNADCRKILQTIIHRPNYTLADMLQACAEVGTQTHAMALLAGAIHQGNKPTAPAGPSQASRAGGFVSTRVNLEQGLLFHPQIAAVLQHIRTHKPTLFI